MTIRVNHIKKELHLSVRDIAFLGIPKQTKSHVLFKSAEIGREIHQKIQDQRKREDSKSETEFFLKYQFKVQEWQVIIRGRIDLVTRSLESIKIEEIKSVFLKRFDGSPDDLRLRPYKLQLQCYAWLFKQCQENIASVSLHLILLNRYDKKQFDVMIPYQDMSKFVRERIKHILSIEKERQTLHEKKIRSLSNLRFPFPFRLYQEEIIQKIEEKINEGINLIIEAPSGLGKTVVSLYPLISKAIFERTKIFFLTAKTTQRYIVEKTLTLFHDQEVDFLALALKAKEKMCVNSFYFCHEEYCPFLKNHLQKFPEDFIERFVKQRGIIDPRSIEEEALASEAFCPFELALDISLEADIIIGDYNYVFHPRVSLQRFFGETVRKKQQYYLIIDEAHNLVDRSLSYYSHDLTQRQITELKYSIRQLKRNIKGIPLPEFLPSALERIFRSLRAEFNNNKVSTHLLREFNLDEFLRVFTRLEEKIPNYLQFLMEREIHSPEDPILNFYYHLRDFVETGALAKNAEEFSILFNSQESKIKILCKDASEFLQQRLNFFKSSIAISATITPFPFYRDLLGFPIDKTVYKRYPSPFPPENRKILVIPEIDTRFKQREYFYDEIAYLINKVVTIKKGKYFAFFPSFKFLEKVASLLILEESLIVLKQSNTMHESDRQEFIDTIEGSSHVLALAVTAGIFAEGIDFPGILDGVFIIGPSLPAVTFERELLQQFYEEKFSNGFAYAYQFPGLTRSFQAAGRLIRTPSDRGIILFIGRRYATPNYATYFPPYYYSKSPRELVSDDITSEIKVFWEKKVGVSSTKM